MVFVAALVKISHRVVDRERLRSINLGKSFNLSTNVKSQPLARSSLYSSRVVRGAGSFGFTSHR